MSLQYATPSHQPLTIRAIFQVWWPLALSWLLMAVELPSLSAIIARLPDPEINLAAYGGIVLPIALIIESPIIMLLAASTALSKDWDSYVKLRRFMLRTGAILTALHLLIALTPLYYVVVEGLIGAPQEIVEPARLGLIIMTPWTWSIAYRRFHQGVLIRFGHSRAVGMGTIIRLVADVSVLLAGYFIQTIPGIVVATSAVACGVVSEAVYAGLRVRPVLRNELRQAPPLSEPLTFPAFISFYIPLVMTSLLTMLTEPLGSAAMSRMPDAVESLAVWPVMAGVIFMLNSGGMAFNEVVVSLFERPQSVRQLRRFALGVSVALTTALFVISATPLASLWFGRVSALPPDLAYIGQISLWFALPQPALTVLQSWYQGAILHSRKTRGITEAIVILLVALSAVLGVGVVLNRFTGLYVGGLAFSIGAAMQVSWLWFRSRPAIRAGERQDQAFPAIQPDTSPAR